MFFGRKAGQTCSQVKNRSSFGIDHILQFEHKSQGKINGKPYTESSKRDIYKEQPYVFSFHSEPVGKTGRHGKTVFLKKIPDVVQCLHRANIKNWG